MDDVHRIYGVNVPYRWAWLGKEIALKEIHENACESFDRLRWYYETLCETNPGSTADLETIGEPRKFRRVYICLSACIRGLLQGCRSLIFLDGTHIKSKWKGSLLSSVTKDGNNGLLTVAYAVVDAENEDNWVWFCTKLKASISSHSLEDGWNKFTFFTDRQPSLVKCIAQVYPGSRHAICLRHLVDNFKQQVMRKYPTKKSAFWSGVLKKTAYALTESDFKIHVNNIITNMPLALSFIEHFDPTTWAHSLFDGNRWGEINNNAVESWNSWVHTERCLPSLAMLDGIRKKIVAMMNERRKESMTMEGKLCTKPNERLLRCYGASKDVTVLRSSATCFEVRDSCQTVVVDIEHWTCTCRFWQVWWIPCEYACSCIETVGKSVYDYCDKLYAVDAYRIAYKGVVFPVAMMGSASVSDDKSVQVRVPDVRAQPGRPKRRRYEAQAERISTKCSVCGRRGHNRRTCDK